MVRSISIYQPKSGIGERKFNQCHIISKHRKNKIFAKQERGGGEREQGVVILSYNIEQNIRDGEKTSDKSKRTVMVCDNEKDILSAFSIELQTKYNVLTAESGEQCIKKYLDAKRSGRKIDLILLDYRLGDTTAYHVAHKIKELNDVRIIIITAYEVSHDIIKEMEDNELVVDIVQKPIALDSLMAKVAQGIGS
ncbi:MAG TPA: response regulator [Nitrososphaeraceae archaeon]|nr:response regulator [Nitrososphaeraceae archaeon]